MPRLLRITTVPISLHLLLQGLFLHMRDKGYDVFTMSADGKEVSNVTKDGTKHIVIPFTRKITPLHDLKCLWKLIKEIKKIEPDIVHTHTPKAGLLGMLAAWVCKVPVRLHTVAGLPMMEASGGRRIILQVAERITFSCAHCIYPNSHGLRKFIEQQFPIQKTKLKVLGNGSSNGIDTVFFSRSPALERQARQFRTDHLIGDHDLVFSFVGRIVRDKGIVELVTAFRAISQDDYLNYKRSDRKLFLLLVGQFEEDLDPLPKPILEFLRNDRQVILAGFQSDVRPFIMASDVFVFPSYREGFPNVIMQASLLEVPCIVSDINGCNEIVNDGVTGVVAQVKDVKALAEAMKMMIHDEAKRKAYADAAKQFVGTNFKREAIWEELSAEYKRMLKAGA